MFMRLALLSIMWCGALVSLLVVLLTFIGILYNSPIASCTAKFLLLSLYTVIFSSSTDRTYRSFKPFTIFGNHGQYQLLEDSSRVPSDFCSCSAASLLHSVSFSVLMCPQSSCMSAEAYIKCVLTLSFLGQSVAISLSSSNYLPLQNCR